MSGKFTFCNWLLENCLCLEFTSAVPASDPFLSKAFINSSRDLLWAFGGVSKHYWLTCSFRLNSGFLRNQSLSECQLPGLRIRVEGAWVNTQFVFHYFPPKPLFTSLDSSLPCPQDPAGGACEAALSGKRIDLGLGYFLAKLKARGLGNHHLVELDVWLQPEQTRQYGLKRGLIKDTVPSCSVPLQASHRIQGCSDQG